MASTVSLKWGRIVGQAVLAGIAGGITIQLYLYLTTILPVHGSLLASWQHIAFAAIGPVANTNPSFAWTGLAVHFLVSIGWAGGYAYFAQRNGFVNQRWFLSGLGYGFTVYMFMLILLLGAGAFVFPATPTDLINVVVAHMVFYGVPVAFVVARMDKNT